MRDPKERIDEIKMSIDNLRADFEETIERLAKERDDAREDADDWRKRYEILVEGLGRQIITGSC